MSTETTFEAVMIVPTKTGESKWGVGTFETLADAKAWAEGLVDYVETEALVLDLSELTALITKLIRVADDEMVEDRSYYLMVESDGACSWDVLS